MIKGHVAAWIGVGAANLLSENFTSRFVIPASRKVVAGAGTSSTPPTSTLFSLYQSAPSGLLRFSPLTFSPICTLSVSTTLLVTVLTTPIFNARVLSEEHGCLL